MSVNETRRAVADMLNAIVACAAILRARGGLAHAGRPFGPEHRQPDEAP